MFKHGFAALQRSMSHGGLRPVVVRTELPRHAWIVQPPVYRAQPYRAQIVRPVRVEAAKRKRPAL